LSNKKAMRTIRACPEAAWRVEKNAFISRKQAFRIRSITGHPGKAADMTLTNADGDEHDSLFRNVPGYSHLFKPSLLIDNFS